MCCRCCWHGCELWEIFKCRKQFELLNALTDIGDSAERYSFVCINKAEQFYSHSPEKCSKVSKTIWVLPSLAWTSMTLATDKARTHNHTHLHHIVATVGLLSPKQVIVRLQLAALYIQIAHFNAHTFFLENWWLTVYQDITNTCWMDDLMRFINPV